MICRGADWAELNCSGEGCKQGDNTEESKGMTASKAEVVITGPVECDREGTRISGFWDTGKVLFTQLNGSYKGVL